MTTHSLPVPVQTLEETCTTCETCAPPTNSEFLAAVFHTLPDGARPAVVSFRGDPHAAKSSSWFARPAGVDLPDDANNYFAISSYCDDENDRFRRTKATFAGLHAIMLDDLGSKVATDRITLPLSWLLETSPGNFQGGFILVEPLTDAALADRLMDAIITDGKTDRGAGGPTARLARLPVAINGKTAPPFPCRLTTWSPETRYTVGQLVAGLGLDMKPPGRNKGSHLARGNDEVFIPAPSENPVITALQARGLYKQRLADGKHDITCPWCTEHTDGVDGGTAYWEPGEGFPLGGFKCQHSHGDRLHIRELLEILEVPPAEAKMKPAIRVQAGEIDRIVDSAEHLLAESGSYYQWGGLIVTVETDPATRETSITPTSQASLLRGLSRAATWERYDARSKGMVTTDPSERVTRVLFDAPRYPHLPVLRGIARQPHAREDLSIVTASGYDPETGRYGAFDPRDYRIPLHPTESDARTALGVLLEVLDEVAFETDTDRALALAAMLTAAVRPSLPTAPGFHVTAHTYGSGKSFLTRLISSLASPQNVPGVAFPGDSEEMRKTLIALLIKSPAVINFDDLNGDIVPSEALKTVMTEEFIGGRLLGVSKDVTCSTRTLFLFSGNNVGPVRDMTRRVLSIHLDPGCENPLTRQFKRPNLESDVRRDRAKYVSAALTIVRAWMVAGQPSAPRLKPLASYGQWSEWCRQPLAWLGQPDPVGRFEEQMKHDPDAELLGRMLGAWRRANGSAAVMIRDVVARGAFDEDFNETLRDVAEVRGTINRQRLGWWLKRHKGRIVDGLKFEGCGSSRGAESWRVVQVSQVVQVSSGHPTETVMQPDELAELF